MARALNKNRMLGSKFAIGLSIAVILASRTFWKEESLSHEVFDLTGSVLVGICAIGRVYSTVFLGGFKNDQLITQGIYSVMRNPLYFFSLLGIIGIALMSNHILVMIGLPLFFLFMYMGLIKREETFLTDKFGTDYHNYKAKTYALIPNFGRYHAPEQMTVNPHFVNKAFLDAVWWLIALPLIELIEYVQSLKIFPLLPWG